MAQLIAKPLDTLFPVNLPSRKTSILLDAGLAIDFVRKHREVPWRALPSMGLVGPGTTGADGLIDEPGFSSKLFAGGG